MTIEVTWDVSRAEDPEGPLYLWAGAITNLGTEDDEPEQIGTVLAYVLPEVWNTSYGVILGETDAISADLGILALALPQDVHTWTGSLIFLDRIELKSHARGQGVLDEVLPELLTLNPHAKLVLTYPHPTGDDDEDETGTKALQRHWESYGLRHKKEGVYVAYPYQILEAIEDR